MLASNSVIGPMPDFPFANAFQLGSTPVPHGVISPIPVTTTRRLFNRNPRLGDAKGELGGLSRNLASDCERRVRYTIVQRMLMRMLTDNSVRRDLCHPACAWGKMNRGSA